MPTRRFLQYLRTLPLLSLLAATHCAFASKGLDEVLRGDAIVILPSQILVGGHPVQVGEIPLGQNSPYLFEGLASRAGRRIPVPNIHVLRSAVLSPDGRRVAYVAKEGVIVADLSGHELGREDHAVGARWSHSGDVLALLLGPPERPWQLDGLAIWDLKKSTILYHDYVDRVDWGANDSVYFGRSTGEYWATHWAGAGPERTSHHGIHVSPDGLYSWDRPGPHWSGIRIFHDRSNVDLAGPIFSNLGKFIPRHAADPFWVSGSGHLLCISGCGEMTKPNTPAEWVCRTAIVDVLTCETVMSWPGMALGPSGDGRSVWISDGEVIKPKRLDLAWPPTADVHAPRGKGGPEEVQLHTSERSWGSWVVPGSRPNPPMEGDFRMRIGDILPRHYTPSMRVTLIDILGPGRAVFAISQPGFAVTLPGGDGPRDLNFFELGPAPVHIQVLGILDAGYSIDLSLAP